MSHVLIISSRRYNGREFWGALGWLQQRGHTFDVASTDTRILDEDIGKPILIKYRLESIPKADYDGLLIISGHPEDTEGYWVNPIVQSWVRDINARGKPIGAICMAVPTIREAAKGKKVSFFPVMRATAALEDAGAILQKVSLMTDDNLVTGENEAVTEMWITNFCDLLEGKKPTYVLHDSVFKRKLRERRPVPEIEHIKAVIKTTGRKGFNE